MERNWNTTIHIGTLPKDEEQLVRWIEGAPVAYQSGNAMLVRHLDGVVGLVDLLGDLMSSQEVNVTLYTPIPKAKLGAIDRELRSCQGVAYAVVCISRPQRPHTMDDHNPVFGPKERPTRT